MKNLRALSYACCLALAACASSPPSAPSQGGTPGAVATPGATPGSTPTTPAAPMTPGEQRTALAAELTVEQQWLESYFRGTPVQIRQREDGALWVDVPREFCFDAGRSNVKPALAAVLDKVAESLRRRPGAVVTLLSAPDDKPGNGAAPLALQRAGQVHKHLRDRGVPLARLGEPKAAAGTGVQLRIVAQPG